MEHKYDKKLIEEALKQAIANVLLEDDIDIDFNFDFDINEFLQGEEKVLKIGSKVKND